MADFAEVLQIIAQRRNIRLLFLAGLLFELLTDPLILCPVLDPFFDMWVFGFEYRPFTNLIHELPTHLHDCTECFFWWYLTCSSEILGGALGLEPDHQWQ